MGERCSRGTEDLPGPGMLRFTVRPLSVALGGMLGSELREALARGLFCRPCGTGGNLPWCCTKGNLRLLFLKHRVRAHVVHILCSTRSSALLCKPLYTQHPPFSARYCQNCSAQWRRQQDGGLRDVSRAKKSPVLQLWLLSHFPRCSLCR